VVSDVELLNQWRDGSKGAAETLMERHFDAMYRFFRTKVSHDVEDLVQSTFLACVEARTAIGNDGFRGYLYGVARHKLVDHLRQKYRGGQVLDLDRISVANLDTTPSHAASRKQEQRLLMDALRRLPVDWQIALELAYWEGLSGREIAQTLGVQENTVRSRLGRARARLREELETLSSAGRADTTLQSFVGDRD